MSDNAPLGYDEPPLIDSIIAKPTIRLYLGGSFDPVHNSHITMLLNAYHRLISSPNTRQPVYAYFLPTARSPFKQHATRREHRLTMLSLVCQHLNRRLSQDSTTVHVKDDTATTPIFNIDYQEIKQPPPSYTIDTLQSLRRQYPSYCLIFLLGADSLASIERWKCGEQLTKFAHLWVVPRDDLQCFSSIQQTLPDLWLPKVTTEVNDLKSSLCGRIYIDSHCVAPISSSAIRRALAKSDFEEAISSLPLAVYNYIRHNQLYHPED